MCTNICQGLARTDRASFQYTRGISWTPVDTLISTGKSANSTPMTTLDPVRVKIGSSTG